MRTFIIFLIAILCPSFMWGQFDPTNPDEPSSKVPVAEFSWSVYNNRVKFYISTSNASRYEWTFGDGTTSKEKNPLHVYASSGSYTVFLKVSNGAGSDIKEEVIQIDTEDNWYLSNSIMLDKNESNVYNYTSLDELFADLFRFKFYPNTHTEITVRGSSFELPSTFDLTARKDEFLKKMKDSGCSINVRGEKSTYTTLTLWQACTKKDFNALMELLEHISFSDTYVSLGDVKVNASWMNDCCDRTVCSGSSVYIYFNSISSSFSYSWKLKEVSSAITGYKESGEEFISDMPLINTSDKTEVLLYEVSFIKDGEVYYTKDCRISVYPVVEKVKLICPSENEVVTSPGNIHFEWAAVPGAIYYDIYYREYTEKEGNSFTYLAGTDNGYIDYVGSEFQFDKSYEWKVVVNGQCGSVSGISRFQVSQAPDLQITSFSTDVETVKPGQAFTVSAIIMNKGTKTISASSWSDKLWEIVNDQWILLEDKSQINRNLEVGESYVLEFKVTAPFDDSNILRYQLMIDYLDQIKEGDESNNKKELLIPLTVVTIPEAEYNALKSLYTLAKGEDWTLTHPWDISKNTVSRNNWENVVFDNDGHVLEINLLRKNLSGTIPAPLFKMPYLRKLDLSWNQLSGNLEKVMAAVSAGRLEDVNLSHNQLEGTVPKAINGLTGLITLDLSYNKLSEIEGVLSSEKLTSLDISNQEILVDPVRLVQNPSLKLPSICFYDHETGKLDVYPAFRISSDDVSVELQYVNGKYVIVNGMNNIRVSSGQSFILTQITGSAWNSHSPFKMSFDQGDANMDDQVSLLDIQHILNYIIGELESSPYVTFNYTAANTYEDALVNVQDIVVLVNMLMRAEPELRSALRVVDEKSSAFLSVEDGYLVLDNSVDVVTAMDVMLEGVSSEQIELLLSTDDYMYAMRDTEKGVRFILLRMNGNGIQLGKTKIMKIGDAEVTIAYAMLSNKAAKEVPVEFEGKKETDTPTDIELIRVQDLEDPMRLQIPEKVREIRYGLYHVGGRRVWFKRLDNPVPGVYSVREELPSLPSGTYVLRSEIHTERDVVVRNIKLFISK